MHASAAEITEKQLDQCIEAYPGVVRKHYERRIKTEKKQAEALERDDWRYEILPQEIDHEDSNGMTLAQLERLVQWKITHGASRPFLPAMIRKNEESSVLEATSAAASTLSPLKDSSTLSEAVEITLSAMTAVSKLTGVGPATASLVLAVYKPDLVPFFQDELWAWCFPEKAGAKLKYDRKEYEMLFRECWQVKQRLNGSCAMVKLEKASFVLQHMDQSDHFGTEGVEEPESESTANADGDDSVEAKKRVKATDTATAADGKRSRSDVEEPPDLEEGTSASRRRSKRTRK